MTFYDKVKELTGVDDIYLVKREDVQLTEQDTIVWLKSSLTAKGALRAFKTDISKLPTLLEDTPLVETENAFFCTYCSEKGVAQPEESMWEVVKSGVSSVRHRLGEGAKVYLGLLTVPANHWDGLGTENRWAWVNAAVYGEEKSNG
jgi:hypothetical protein